nr:MAG TPA: hypothetical protein [Caudoviricetes sp.]
MIHILYDMASRMRKNGKSKETHIQCNIEEAIVRL